MRKTPVLLTLFVTLMIFTACQPQTVPEYQIVIETIPSQLMDVINVLQIRSGVYIFDPKTFDTGNDTYLLISHGKADDVLVDISTMNFTSDNVLQISLRETTASMSRPYSVIKLLDFKDFFIINDNEGKFPMMNTEELYFTSRGHLSRIKDNKVDIVIDDSTVLFEIDQTLQEKINASSLPLAVAGEEVVIEYRSSGKDILATNLTKIIESGTQEAEYVGQIDSHSIEVMIDGNYRAYQLSMAARIYLEQNEPATGSIITFEYYTPNSSTGIITNFITK